MTMSLLPDCGGVIREIAICLPPALFAPREAAKLQVLQNLAEALCTETTLVILAAEATRDVAQDWLQRLDLRATPRLLLAPSAAALRDHDFWIQDPFLVAVDEAGTRLLPLPETDRPSTHAQWLATAGYGTAPPVPWHMTGGNHLCGLDFRVVGAGSLNLAMQRDGSLSFDAATARHASLDDRRLHVFGFAVSQRGHPGTLAQQPHHVDLVLSVTGCHDVTGRPILLLADPRAGTSPDAAPVPGWTEQLDASAARLMADGFCVRRNPVPYVRHPQWSPNPNLRAYNNVLVENEIRIGRTNPLVWLPHFADLEPALSDFDHANRQMWHELGFDPIPVPGCSALANVGGAIRCVSKVLLRAPFVPR